MAQASRKRIPAQPLGNQLTKNIKEVSMIILGALSIYLFIALLSFHPSDPGWSHAVSTDNIKNNAGEVGAWIADVLLYLFGYLGYLFPIIFAYSGWRLFKSRQRNESLNYLRYSIRIFGLLLVLIGGCGLAWLHFQAGVSLPNEVHGAGGILGDATGSKLNVIFGSTGSTLMMLTMLLIGITLFTSFSWLWVMDTTGHWTLRLLSYGSEVRSRIKDNVIGREARRRREIIIKDEQEKFINREPVKIEPSISTFEMGERLEREKQVNLFDLPSDSVLPSIGLLDEPQALKGQYSQESLEAMSRQVELKLKEFGIEAQVVAVHPGPVITGCFQSWNGFCATFRWSA